MLFLILLVAIKFNANRFLVMAKDIMDNNEIVSINIPKSEMQALYELYNATDGKNWKWINSTVLAAKIKWNFTESANPCRDNWAGLICSNSSSTEYSHITEIRLANYNLRGTLPASIDSFSKLESLNLRTSR